MGNVLCFEKKGLKDIHSGKVIEVDFLVRKSTRSEFNILYLNSLTNIFDILGGKKYQILKFLLRNKDTNNLLATSTRKLAEEINVSRPKIIETLCLLESSGIISRKSGLIMLNPAFIHKGSEQKERYLLQKFISSKS